MNGYTLANHFRKLRYSFPFSSVEADLFYELVAVCNERNWPTEFQYSNPLLCATLGMVETTLIRARNRLKQAGLLEFTSGHKRSPTVYRFLDPDAPQIPLPKASKSASTNASTSERISARRSDTPYKEQTKRKTKTPAPAPAVGACASPADLISLPDWQAWLQANAPDVQRLKTPFTADTWQRLVADFGEALVHEVVLAMQNHAGLTRKYTTAHLTARNWCQRRQPAAPEPAPRPPLPANFDPSALFRPALNGALADTPEPALTSAA
ncbi:hypothetical protein [Hymenobacter negativus]|uniref:Helix-turn-helix domain-containing protein n=1 Tax=Hymenobacter negativus TaxID=2795026 RepID=A0ABS3QI12_9BACT|nr:hypothetical protein [Hymenobacter negativus]MBO2010892.1 hypothetical protein [Hymenobacter negativus]